MKTFAEIKPAEIEGNPIHLIGQEWMLITAGTPQHFNTMTASWGSLGGAVVQAGLLLFRPAAALHL